MFLNEEFISVYEELSNLNEAKADTQQLVDFAGKDLADRFLNIKHRLKGQEKDLYYWIKNKSVAELEQTVSSVENTSSSTKKRKQSAQEGAGLVCETEHWKIYHITSFEASQYYGRDTRWCITGINNYGDTYWNQYTSQGVAFYFLISKQDYDSRGKFSKIAIAYYTKEHDCEVFNQQDDRITLADIPYVKEISIPDVNLVDKETYACVDCGILMARDAYVRGPGDAVYCDSCFNSHFSLCTECGNIFDLDKIHTVPDGEALCQSCFDEAGYMHCEFCDEVLPNQRNTIKETACGEIFCDYCFYDDYLPTEAGRVDRLVLMAKYENFQDFFYELDEEQEVMDIIKEWQEAKRFKKITKYSEEEIKNLELNFIKHMNSIGINIDTTVFE
jgi:hypothetical protein